MLLSVSLLALVMTLMFAICLQAGVPMMSNGSSLTLPLFTDLNGTISVQLGAIAQVGDLSLGSISRGFGKAAFSLLGSCTLTWQATLGECNLTWSSRSGEMHSVLDSLVKGF